MISINNIFNPSFDNIAFQTALATYSPLAMSIVNKQFHSIHNFGSIPMEATHIWSTFPIAHTLSYVLEWMKYRNDLNLSGDINIYADTKVFIGVNNKPKLFLEEFISKVPNLSLEVINISKVCHICIKMIIMPELFLPPVVMQMEPISRSLFSTKKVRYLPRSLITSQLMKIEPRSPDYECSSPIDDCKPIARRLSFDSSSTLIDHDSKKRKRQMISKLTIKI
jgi:hypothetical protein